MTDEIKQILESHGDMLKSQGETLESHGKMLESNVEVLKTHGEILESHGEQLDLIAMKVVDHDEKLQQIKENMATRADIDNVTNILDRIVKLVEKKDQELTFVTHDMKNFEDRVEILEKDVNTRIKPALGLI